MTSQAFAAKGTILQIGDGGSPEVFTVVAEINEISGGGGEASEIEVTSLESTAKEFIAGLADNGTYTLSGNFIPGDAGQIKLRQAKEATGITKKNFKIINPDPATTTLSFEAAVLSFQNSWPQGQQVTVGVTLRVSGAVTYS